MEKVCTAWEFFKGLHEFWGELPHYNPVSVSTSEHGQDHAGNAATLFQQDSSLSHMCPTTPSEWSQSPLLEDSDHGHGSGIKEGTSQDLAGDGGGMSTTSTGGSVWEGDKDRCDIDEEVLNLVCDNPSIKLVVNSAYYPRSNEPILLLGTLLHYKKNFKSHVTNIPPPSSSSKSKKAKNKSKSLKDSTHGSTVNKQQSALDAFNEAHAEDTAAVAHCHAAQDEIKLC
ncbi:hypothetical protein NP233_g9833 [Leucocoprinus birnbaumii]|uniref:Uncharacterized protein n=1 Tax=Leucocoprinus birnbaumii TaxID=56174 RepID=A0AAD5YMU1_9AGAR|nr:hypothetical protein NP233_g9833 [Leucocoprinus birnbaumii]